MQERGLNREEREREEGRPQMNDGPAEALSISFLMLLAVQTVLAIVNELIVVLVFKSNL